MIKVSVGFAKALLHPECLLLNLLGRLFLYGMVINNAS